MRVKAVCGVEEEGGTDVPEQEGGLSYTRGIGLHSSHDTPAEPKRYE
jgi:hypothetical protein